MTCIVGVEGPDGSVVMGGDSFVGGSHATDLTALPKVWLNGDNLLVGISGNARLLSLIRFNLDAPRMDCGNHEYCFKWAEALRELLGEKNCAQDKDGKDGYIQVLLGRRGEVWEIGCDYAVHRSTFGYAAIGCASHVAEGSLATTAHLNLGSVDRAHCALVAAERHHAFVRRPWTVLIQTGAPRAP